MRSAGGLDTGQSVEPQGAFLSPVRGCPSWPGSNRTKKSLVAFGGGAGRVRRSGLLFEGHGLEVWR